MAYEWTKNLLPFFHAWCPFVTYVLGRIQLIFYNFELVLDGNENAFDAMLFRDLQRPVEDDEPPSTRACIKTL